MGRAIAATLALVFLSQATGLAAEPQALSPTPLISTARLELANIAQFASATELAAIVSGDSARWQLMHAPAPTVPTPPPVDLTRLRNITRAERVTVGNGLRGQPPEMLTKPLPSSGSVTPSAMRTISLGAPAPTTGTSTKKVRAPIRSLSVTSNSPNLTGVNPWWTYEAGAIPGNGKYMVNVGNGNLLVQAVDVDIPERGVDLAFQRTYNSNSGRDYSADDGAPTPGQYGNGWTNTFDAHLATNSSGGISVFDIDGARYDYTPNGSCLTPPAGMHNTLCSDGGNGYYWTKKNGTVYYFWRPDLAGVQPSNAGYAGRLYMIFARNALSWIRLTYSWDNGDASISQNLAQISVAHEDGQALTLSFANFNGHRLLSTITRPDGVQLSYSYDTSDGLSYVYLAPNDTSNSQRWVQYGYYSNRLLSWGSSPRYFKSGGTEGGYDNFYYDSSNRVNNVQIIGFPNFVPADTTGTAIQPSLSTGIQNIASTTFSYPSSSETSLTDIDGHAANWYYDASSRVTQTQEWAGGSLWLVTSATWDGNNNLTETVDARDKVTDYAYDDNGNTIAVALPTVTLNGSTFRPTSLYSYDRTNNANNIVAYCDPVYSHANGHDWTSNPGGSDSLCPSVSGTNRYTWYYQDGNELFGRLTDSYTPRGYHRLYSYDQNLEGGYQFGLPTAVTGDSVMQADSTVRSPHQTFTYDAYGNVTTHSAGVGTWSLSYDSNNRLTSATDADGVTTRTCYFENGQVQFQQSASQYAADGATCGAHSASFAYDVDGDVTNETHHYGSQAGTTTKYYDGEDRLVEVAQPHDATDLYSYAWLTRYWYDLSRNNTAYTPTVDGVGFHAYGNLFKTQEYLPSNPVISSNTTPGSPTWTDVRGTAFDPLDRATASYENAFGTTPKISKTYDSNGYYGLLTQSVNATGQQTNMSYFDTGWLQEKSYLNDGGVTPSETYAYDADGRTTSITSSQFGTESWAYDADGRLTSDTDPNSGGYQSPATLSYTYYDDGLRKDISIASSAVTASSAFQYSYRDDGLLQTQHLTYPISGNFAWTYTNAGRELTQSDPYTGSVITLAQSGGSRTMQAKTFTYDGYGRVASLVLPQGYTYGSFTYDGEDETTGYSRSNAWCAHVGGCTPATATRTQTYNVRAEMVAITDSSRALNYSDASADGTLVSTNGSGGTLDGFDARSGMITNKYLAGSTPYAYDAAGRQTTVTNLYPNSGSPDYVTRGYDAENHVVSQAYTGGSFECTSGLQMCGGWPASTGNTGVVPSGVTNSYGWGPNGHPIQLVLNDTNTVGANETVSVHWDGDDVLFALTQNTIDFEVGKLGSFNPGPGSSLSVADRDMTGQQVSSHTGSLFGAWDGAPPTRQCATCSKGRESDGISFPGSVDSTYVSSSDDSFAPPVTFLSSVREDGYTDGFGNTFQGVRAYDPNLGQWTSPDAYMGDAHDPMSQKPFIWNHNNPTTYVDPSGFQEDDVRNDNKDNIDYNIWRDAITAEVDAMERDEASQRWSKGNYQTRRINFDRHMDDHGHEFIDENGQRLSPMEITELGVNMYERGTVGTAFNSSLRIGDKDDGAYTVYDSQTGNFGVFGADGEILSMQNLFQQGKSDKEIRDYLSRQGGRPVSAIPCHRSR